MKEGAQVTVPKDIDEAAKWIRKAAEQGNASAQIKESAAYFLGRGVPKSTEEGWRWLEKAASHEKCDLDVENARYSLGSLYRHGRVGVSDQEIDTIPNGREAVRWLEKTAECAGIDGSLAMGELADMYKTGDGVPQDYAEAAKWLRIGAEAGAASSQFDLAEMYRDGLGVPQDYVAAHMWFNLAAAPKFWSYRAGVERDSLAAKMTNGQINEAQRLAREWRPKCGEEAAQVRALIQNNQ
ncbi:MAG: tetratricopeptide repeat protein [Methyloceanibacter sp.]